MEPNTNHDKKPSSELHQSGQSGATKVDVFRAIRRTTAWVMIISATLFATVGVLAVWQVFGDYAGDIVWRAFSSLAIIAFAALVVNVASRIAMNK
jgi:hypothetical protein